MNTQFIKDQNGEDAFVVLPVAEWQDMLDAIDSADVRARLKANEETFPHEVVVRLIEENSIKVYREYRGIKQKALAETVGISAAYLSEIEKGKKAGAHDLRVKIAEALSLDLDDLD